MTDHEIDVLEKQARRPNYGSAYYPPATVLALIEDLKAAQTEATQWKAQATNRGVSYVELFAEKQNVKKQLSDALNENARLKDENAALKVGEAGELLAKAQAAVADSKRMYDWLSIAFDKYREDVESGKTYQIQRKVSEMLLDERDQLTAELAAARKVADAAFAWCDCEEDGEVEAKTYATLLSAVREYRDHLEAQAVIARCQPTLEKLDDEAALAAMEAGE